MKTNNIFRWLKKLCGRASGVITAIAAICLTIITFTSCFAAQTLRLAIQKTGTASLEVSIIKEKGLDKAVGLDLVVSELASTEAGKIALRGNSADMIITDIFWAARENALGDELRFHPYSSALGAIMAQAQSPLKSLADLKGKKLGVAGGPLDKSWLILQAYAKNKGFDLKKEAEILYGTPPLLAEELREGRIDATLNYWNFCASLEAEGAQRFLSMEKVEESLGIQGPFASVGYVFEDRFAKANPDTLAKFFTISGKARDILKMNTDEAEEEWAKIALRLGIKDKAQLGLFRKTYLDGIPRRLVAAEAADAKKLFELLKSSGGAELLGPAKEFDPAIYDQAGY
jgi:NitT/TauT family transport system substrate-binding protein